MSELKPCPFCGGNPEADHQSAFRWLKDGRLDHEAAIYCTSCDANMTMCRGDTPELSDEDRMTILAEEWNRRTAAPVAAPVQVRALEWDDKPGGTRGIWKAENYSFYRPHLKGRFRLERYDHEDNDSFILGWFDEIDAAKNAAQSDYETRIRSALLSGDTSND